MIPIALVKQHFATATSRHSAGRRLRLWEIAPACHCTIIGVCLPISVLRRLAGKVLTNPGAVDDYTLHAHAVQAASARNPLSRLIQDELESRYASVVQSYRKWREPAELATAWSEAVANGRIAGALWAMLTHPVCDAAMAEALSRQMHMLQHQAGAAMHLDVARYHALIDENATLVRALAKAQQHCERMTREKCTHIAALETRLLDARTELISRDGELAVAQEALATLRAQLPDQAARQRLTLQLHYQEERSARLSLENARLQKALASRPNSPSVQVIPVSAALETAETTLDGQRILCVGGRENAVVTYRQLVEQAGGAFLHHDGGVEDRLGQLDSALGAADLVICQTGCISHNAYWRVKDHCKRTGKRCAFVETPSAAGLARGLRHLLADVLVAHEDGVQNEATGGTLTTGSQQT